MPYSNPCTSAKIEYAGDGSTVLYTFPFEYTKQSDVKVYIWNDNQYELNTDWTFENATTIRFNTAPAASTNPVGQNVIRIVRETDIEPLNAQFYPGASIKAKDLNDNFEQLKFAVEENRCIADANYWKRYEDTLHSNEVWSGTDNTIATTAAIDAAFLRQDSTETINSGMPWSNSDAFVATTAAISARIVDMVEEVGGFVPIDNETSFPEENPDINDGDGTLISIKEISVDRGIGGGSVTIPNGAGTNTVTITGIPATGMLAGYGAIVETTATLHTYEFHRLAPPAIEVTTVANNIGDVQITANDIDNINTVADDIANINTVEGSIANVNTVATNIADVNTVATNISDINVIEDNIADIQTVASDLNEAVSEIDVVATNIADVNTVGTNIANVNTVATNIGDVNTVATNISDINTVEDNIGDIQIVEDNIAAINTVANDLNEPVSEIDTVATNITNVNAVGTDITNVNTVATNLSSVNNFADKYRIGPNDPTTDNDEGDLFYNTTSDTLKIWDGSAWQVGVTETTGFVATAGGTMHGDLVMGDGTTNNNITNLADPSNAQDAATKNYVDTQIGGIDELVEDLSPQLGGNLDVNGQSIVSANNGNITLDPHGTGTIVVAGAITAPNVNDNIAIAPTGTGVVDVNNSKITNVTNPTAAQDAATKNYVDTALGNLSANSISEDNSSVTVVDNGTNNGAVEIRTDNILQASIGSGASTFSSHVELKNQKEVRYYETTANGTNYVGFKAPASVTSDVTFTLPDGDGAANEVLTTNGSGVLSFGKVTKIEEGDSFAEITDSGIGNAGAFTVSTENAVRLKIGPQGQFQVGANANDTGSVGQVLTSNGTAAAPTWEDAASGYPLMGANGTKRWAVEHANTIDDDYTITSGNNVINAGPLTVNSGKTVTVEANAHWIIS